MMKGKTSSRSAPERSARRSIGSRAVLKSGAAILALCLSTWTEARADTGGGETLVYLDHVAHTSLYPPAGGFYPNGMILGQIADRLTWQDPQSHRIEPWIADHWDVSPDLMIFTFHLRHGVTFSDGAPLDAQAVARNYDVYGLGDKRLHLPPSEVFANYQSSEVLDPYTLRVRFSRPAPGFLQGTSVLGSGLLSPATLDRPFEQFGQGRNIIGSGPFVIAQDTPGKEIRLVRRPDYGWWPQALGAPGNATLAAIDVLIIPEDSIRIGALMSGQADFIREIAPFDEEQIRRGGFRLYAPSTGGVANSIAFHVENAIAGDVRVRRALLHGTDRAELVRTLYSSNYPLARSILVASAEGFEDLSARLTYDPALAARLLDEAGWRPGPDGIRVKDGVVLALAIHEAPQHPQSHELLVMLAEQWRRLGVRLDILNGSPSATILDNLNPAKTALADVEVGRADADVLLEELYPTRRNVLLQAGGQSQHARRFRDSVLNDLLDRIETETDPVQRMAHVVAVQDYVIDQAYMIPIFEEPQIYAGRGDLSGVLFEAVGRPVLYKAAFAPGERP